MVALISLVSNDANASHIAGADFQYECIGPNTYLITLNVFRDCDGIPAPTSVTINFTNSCGGSMSETFQRNSLTEVSQLCNAQLSNSTCNSNAQNALPGMEQAVFSGVVVLPPCDTWKMTWSVCCRNATVANLVNPSSKAMWIPATLNSVTDSCFSSPYFTGQPIPYVCFGQNVNYNFAVTNPSGDSIFYEFVNPYDDENDTIAFVPGYSPQVPLPGINLNSATGQVNFVPTTLGNFVLSVKACSYDYATGALKGCVTRDIQFVVINCTNNTVSIGNITNFDGKGGGAYLLDSLTIAACVGDSMEFDIVFMDPDTADSITLSSNILAALPGSQVTYIHGNPATAHVKWNATSGLPPYNPFTLAGVDDACPTPGVATGSYAIDIIKSTYAGPDVAICRGEQWAVMNAVGGDTFVWNVVSGSPIDTVVTSATYNATCRNCASPSFSPQLTTVYEVVSNLSSGCKNRDTLTLTSAPSFVASAGPDTIYCGRDSIQLWSSATIGGKFTYRWDQAKITPDYLVQNPKTLPPLSSELIVTNYSVTMTSAAGCVKTASTTVSKVPPVPNPFAESDITTICNVGDSAHLNLYLEEDFDTTCAAVEYLFGTGYNHDILMTGAPVATTSSSWPAPFGNSYSSARQQYLYRASELHAMGLRKGTITELGFNVTALNGVSRLRGYSIKFECTTLNSMPLSLFYPVTQEVMSPRTIDLVLGWNMLEFSTPYIWDGVSNIIVEICFDNRGHPTPGNAITSTREVTVTPFHASIGYYTDSTAAACGRGAALFAKFERPDTRFTFGGGIDSAAYSYRWYPDYNISDTAVNSPFVYPDTTTTYEVIFVDTFGVCADTSSITISVSGMDAGPDTVICTGDTVTLRPWVQDACTTGTPIILWYSLDGGIVTSINGFTPTVTCTSTSTFFLEYTNLCGCMVKDSVTVIVNEMGPPNLVYTYPDCGLSNGEILIHSNGGSSPFTFSLDSGAFQVDSLFTGLPMNGYYTQYMDSNGCLSPMLYDTLQNVNTTRIDSIVGTDPLCFNSLDGELQIYHSGGTAPHSYSVRAKIVKGLSVDGGINWTLNNPVTGLGKGGYNVIVRDVNLCVSFPDSATLGFNPELLIDTVTGTNLTCFEDSSGTITVAGTGGVLPYTYSVDSGNVFQSASLFNILHAGIHNVIVQDANGCLTNVQPFNLTQPSEFKAVLNITNDSCFNACGGSASTVMTGGTTPFNYGWVKGVNQIGINNPTVGGLCAGLDYVLTVTDSNSCQTVSPFVITQPDELLAGFTVQNSSCFGSDDGLITMTGTGGIPPYTYSVDGGATFSTSPIFGTLAAGTYNLMIADSGSRCTGVTTAVVLEPNEIEVTTNGSSKKVCITGCTALSATAIGGAGAPFSFIWNQGFDSNSVQTACPTQTTLYSVYAVDSIGCSSAPKVITVSLYDSLIADAGPDIDICPGEEGQLNALGTGGNGVGISYQWSPVYGLSNAFINNPLASPAVTTKYAVRITDNCETPAVYDSVTVNVHVEPTMEFIASDTTEGCEPFDITLVNQSSPVQFAEWTVGEGVTAHGFTADISDLKAGIYDVHLRVITPDGCEGTMVKPNFITVQPRPTAKFRMTPEETTLYSTTIQMEDESIGNIVTWDWNFAGQGTSTDQHPIFKFAEDTGTYEVTLFVVTDKMCEDETVNLLRIGSEYNMYVPNSFTPNGDGNNDVFAPMAIGVNPDDYSLLIYDRWGGVIFESKSLKQPWDGRALGTSEMAQNGIYVWKIVANDNTDNTEGHTYTGTVNLIR